MEQEVFVKPEPTGDTGMLFEDIESNIKVETKDEVVETVANDETLVIFYVCNICMKKFESPFYLEHHLTIVHRPLTVNILAGAYCCSCRMIFDENIFDSHLCKSKIASLPGVSHKIHTSTKKLECRICNKLSVNFNKLFTHLRTVHRPITANYEGKSDCSFCDFCKDFFKDDLFSHFPCNAVDVKCFFCLTKMPPKHHFITHNLLWEGFRKFQCNICNVYTKLMNFTELNEHIKLHNSGLGVFQCVKCKLHMNQSDLEKHYQKCHQGCKCVHNPCSCEEYNEYYYIKHILKVDIPYCSTRQKYVRTCTSSKTTEHKNSCFSPGSSKSSETIESPPSTNLTNEAQAVLDDKSTSTPEELVEEDRIDKAAGLEDYKSSRRTKNKNVSPKWRRRKRLSKLQLKKIRYQGLARYHENKKQSKPSQNSVFTQEQDTSTSEIMENEIVQEETMELSYSQPPDNEEKIGSSPKLTENYLAGPNANHKKSKRRRKNTPTQAIANQVQDSSDNQAFPENYLQVVLDDVNSEHSSVSSELHQSSDVSPDPQTNDSDCKDTCQVCAMCGLDFSSTNLLHDHLRQVHRLREVYIKQSKFCAHCKMFKLKTHFPCKKNVGEDICHFCNMAFPKREHFELHHIEFHTYREMFCRLCNDKVHYKINTLNEHRITAHNDIGVYECLLCEAKFSTNLKMKEHLVYNKHKFDVENSAEMYKLQKNYNGEVKYTKCKHCDRVFFEDRYIKYHRCQQFNCFECSKTFVQQTSLIYHMAIHTKENVFKCSICDILFDKQSKLTAHMQIHNENGTNPHKCDICNRLFSHKCKLLVHKISHRENTQDK